MACNVLLLLALLAQTRAQLSLYIPDTDPQPLSAVELGVGNDGRTTWEILPGEPTGSWVSQVEDFPTLTLAEGPSDALLTGAPDLDFAVSCTLLPTTPGVTPLAACTNLAAGGAGWEEAAVPLEVQTGAAAAPGSTGRTSGGGGGGAGTGPGTGAGTGTGAGPSSTGSVTRAISPNGPVSGSPMVPSSTGRPQTAGARCGRIGVGGGWTGVAGWAVVMGVMLGVGVGWVV